MGRYNVTVRFPVQLADIFCGASAHIRSSSLGDLLQFESGPSHAGEEDACFDTDIVIATTHGQWQFRSGAQRFTIDRQSLVLGNAGDAYGCRHPHRHATRGLAVCLKPGAVDPGFRLFSKPVVDATGIQRLFHRALQSSSDDDFDSVLFTIFSEVSALSLSSEYSASRLRIERAKRFLEAHAFEQIKLADLANELGLSPFTTIRQFKASTGKTPHAYLLEFRLEAAKRMLLRTSASVESIAKSVGFDDLAYFSRFFKRRTGVTPSSFRAA